MLKGKLKGKSPMTAKTANRKPTVKCRKDNSPTNINQANPEKKERKLTFNPQGLTKW